ncbi:MAG: DUF4276 family protein [Chlorobiaceae bacterium]|nr:DUF4276 family protein [Chlorobiaceae bacterium]
MSDYTEVIVLVEGQTEKIFVESMLLLQLAERGVFLTPIIISKPGQKGGDVRFARVKKDIELHLKQRTNTYVTLFVDYYGIGQDWPGLAEARLQITPAQKAAMINRSTKEDVERLFGPYGADHRFIPYVAMHEFETLLFSDPSVLAENLCVNISDVEQIITACGEPENINDSPVTAPSKRLKGLSDRFRKTSTGIGIAQAIGLEKMREQCTLFNEWLTVIENLTKAKVDH